MIGDPLTREAPADTPFTDAHRPGFCREKGSSKLFVNNSSRLFSLSVVCSDDFINVSLQDP